MYKCPSWSNCLWWAFVKKKYTASWRLEIQFIGGGGRTVWGGKQTEARLYKKTQQANPVVFMELLSNASLIVLSWWKSELFSGNFHGICIFQTDVSGLTPTWLSTVPPCRNFETANRRSNKRHYIHHVQWVEVRAGEAPGVNPSSSLAGCWICKLGRSGPSSLFLLVNTMWKDVFVKKLTDLPQFH